MRKTPLSRHGSKHGFGPFVTWVIQTHRGRVSSLQTSRRQRKGLPPVAVASSDVQPGVAVEKFKHAWLRFWAPRRLAWWIAVLFMVGSVLFALGGAQAIWPGSAAIRWLDAALVGWIFFMGSLFFTAAAYLQWLEAINNDVADTIRTIGPGSPRWRFLGWRMHNLGYLAAATQLVGTILFNINTADALITGLGWAGQDLLVWTPNMTGAVCFLFASHFALMEISHHWLSFQPRLLSWWIAAINMLGSIFFMVSAVTSFVTPGSGMADAFLANSCTFADAVCFFVGAYLLIPEQFEEIGTVTAPAA